MTEQADVAIAMLEKLPEGRIFAVPPNTKKASGDWTSAASDNPSTIVNWFEALPGYNVALFIGDRVAVIDVEGPNKANEKSRQGAANLSGLEQTYGALPPTLTTLTPSGGRHHYFLLPPGVVFNRKAKLLDQEGVELRSRVHYVLLPPSRVEGYGDYVFADGFGLNDVAVATLPNAWVDAIRGFEEPDKTTSPRLDDLFQSISSGGTERKPIFEPIVTGCAFMQHFVEDAAELSEPDWYAGLSIVARCENGHELAHKLSEPYPGYTGTETDRKIEHTVTAAKPSTCRFIGGDLGFDGCKNCPFKASAINSPIALGYQKPELVKEQTHFVFVIDIEQYIDLKRLKPYRPTAFAAMVRHKLGKNPHDQLMASKTMPKAASTDYLVGNDHLIVDATGNKVLNIWQRDGVSPCEGDASELLEFIKHLIPDQTSRDHLLDYLACLLQWRGTKINHALALVGPQGVGKSTLGRIVEKLFGSNARKVEGEQLGSKWTERLVNCELLIAEEAALGEKYETYERLKELITGETFSVEQKHMPIHEGRTPRGILIMSNHDNPLTIAANDRRFCVISSVEEKADDGFFDRVNRAIADDGQVGAFANELLKRDIARFNPKAAPPMTEAKEIAIAASRTPLAQALAEVIERLLFWRDVTTLEEVMQRIAQVPWFNQSITAERVKTALKQYGAVPLAQTRLGASGRVRPWAIRNQSIWKVAEPEKIRGELCKAAPQGVACAPVPLFGGSPQLGAAEASA